MSSYKNKKEIIFDTSFYITTEEKRKLIKKFKERFKAKEETGITDVMFYNFLRGKDIFKGIERIRDHSYHKIYFADIYSSFAASTSRYPLIISMYEKEVEATKWYLDLANEIEGLDIKTFKNNLDSKINVIIALLRKEAFYSYKMEV